MAVKHIEPGSVSVAAAIATGDTFRAHAESFWLLVQENSGAADIAAKENLGELIVSATSLALSIELYLKGLLLVLGQKSPMSHDLGQLFDLVPKKVRQDIEAEYGNLRQSERSADTSGVSVHVVRSGGAIPTFKRSAGTLSMDIGPLLKRNASAFLTWRYLFAHGSTKAGEPLRYEYVRLQFAADATRQTLLKYRTLN